MISGLSEWRNPKNRNKFLYSSYIKNVARTNVLCYSGFMTYRIPSVDILVITALAEEYEALVSVFDIETEYSSEFVPLKYAFGNIVNSSTGLSISIAFTCLYTMGNPDSGSLSAYAIRDIEPSIVIMFGIAAGIKERIPLGGVIVPTKIFYYEQAKLNPKKERIRPISIHVDDYLKNGLMSYNEKAKKPYKVKFGPFAVGEKIVADESIIERLKEYEPKLLGIEMESYGVATAASYAWERPRFISIRGISDHADETKNDDSRQLALKNASDFLNGYLQTGDIAFGRPEIEEQTDHLIALHHLSLYRRASIQESIKTSLPQFQDFIIKEICIDQTSFFRNGILNEPGLSFNLQKDFANNLDMIIQKNPKATIGYFSLAHIPLIFHIGYEINRREIQVFPTNRQSGKWINLSKQQSEFPRLIIKNLPENEYQDVAEIALKMSISYPVLDTQLESVINLNEIPAISLSLDDPKPDIINSENQLDFYAATFQETLFDIRKCYPSTQKIHLFYSGPPTFAFRCGQQISKTVDPDIVVYNFSNKDTPNYGWSLEIQSGKITDLRM